MHNRFCSAPMAYSIDTRMDTTSSSPLKLCPSPNCRDRTDSKRCISSRCWGRNICKACLVWIHPKTATAPKPASASKEDALSSCQKYPWGKAPWRCVCQMSPNPPSQRVTLTLESLERQILGCPLPPELEIGVVAEGDRRGKLNVPLLVPYLLCR